MSSVRLFIPRGLQGVLVGHPFLFPVDIFVARGTYLLVLGLIVFGVSSQVVLYYKCTFVVFQRPGGLFGFSRGMI